MHDPLKEYQELAAENASLKERIREMERSEASCRALEEALRGRVKELSCLYDITDIIASADSLDELLQKTVERIPRSWYYPEDTCARIVLKNREYRSAGFIKSPWRMSADIVVHGKQEGTVEVCYLRKTPERDEGPFVKEERSLIAAIAERLGGVIERKQGEEERDRLVAEIHHALSQVRKLSGLLPICSACRKIRDDQGNWKDIEAYIQDNSEAEVSHGICPECTKTLYPDFYERSLKKKDV